MDTADTPLHDLQPTLARLRAAWQANKPDHAQRRDDLQRLRDALKRRLDEMARTIAADFGHRSLDESRIADGMTVKVDAPTPTELVIAPDTGGEPIGVAA